MTRTRLVFAAGAIGLGILAAAPTQAAEIRLVGDMWCPMNCDPGSRPGYIIEVVQEAMARSGHTVKYEIGDWDEAVARGLKDPAVNLVGATRSDADGYVIGEEDVGSTVSVVVTRRDGAAFKDLADLKGRKIAASEGYSYGDDIDAFLKANAQNVLFGSGENPSLANLEAVLAGRADAALDDRNVAEYVLVDQQAIDLVSISDAGAPEPLYIAFSPANPDAPRLAKDLDEGLKALKKDGTFARIMAKYNLSDRSKPTG